MRPRSCRLCGKTIKATSERAEFLYLLPGDREAWLCGARCLKRYDNGEEISND
jgi:hypothetical protein